MGNQTADFQIRSLTSEKVRHPNHSATEDVTVHTHGDLIVLLHRESRKSYHDEYRLVKVRPHDGVIVLPH